MVLFSDTFLPHKSAFWQLTANNIQISLSKVRCRVGLQLGDTVVGLIWQLRQIDLGFLIHSFISKGVGKHQLIAPNIHTHLSGYWRHTFGIQLGWLRIVLCHVDVLNWTTAVIVGEI